MKNNNNTLEQLKAAYSKDIADKEIQIQLLKALTASQTEYIQMLEHYFELIEGKITNENAPPYKIQDMSFRIYQN